MKPVKFTYKDRAEWYLNGKLHRTEGPAIEYFNGDKFWCQNDKNHRTDGPAIEHADGKKEWWVNGKLHRTDGPAVECVNGDKFWFQNGKRHRTDGPAREWADGLKHWWFDGEKLSESEWLIKVGKENQNTLSNLIVSLANSNHKTEAEEIAMLCITFNDVDNKQRIYDRAKELRKLLK